MFTANAITIGEVLTTILAGFGLFLLLVDLLTYCLKSDIMKE